MSAEIRVALWHAAPVLAEVESDLDANTAALIEAMSVAAEHDVSLFITPELALTGYQFADAIGLEWMRRGRDRWVGRIQQAADDFNLGLVLGHVEWAAAGHRYNTAYVFSPEGKLLGKHRKINTIPGAEDWSTASREPPALVSLDGVRLGVLLCADAWNPRHAQSLADRGVELIVSPANWWPGEYGPGDTWEDRVAETGVPMLVNNRTGKERALDMSQAQSVFVVPNRGESETLLVHQSRENRLLLLDIEVFERRLLGFETVALPPNTVYQSAERKGRLQVLTEHP
ncbi:MAG: carbon-nitrogen hydrolase family protein [Pseudomonadota bacterium]